MVYRVPAVALAIQHSAGWAVRRSIGTPDFFSLVSLLPLSRPASLSCSRAGRIACLGLRILVPDAGTADHTPPNTALEGTLGRVGRHNLRRGLAPLSFGVRRICGLRQLSKQWVCVQ